MFGILCGDVNGVKFITATDSQVALQMATGVHLWSPLADVDSNGAITSTDVQMILNASVAFDPAAELPTCGQAGGTDF